MRLDGAGFAEQTRDDGRSLMTLKLRVLLLGERQSWGFSICRDDVGTVFNGGSCDVKECADEQAEGMDPGRYGIWAVMDERAGVRKFGGLRLLCPRKLSELGVDVSVVDIVELDHRFLLAAPGSVPAIASESPMEKEKSWDMATGDGTLKA